MADMRKKYEIQRIKTEIDSEGKWVVRGYEEFGDVSLPLYPLSDAEPGFRSVLEFLFSHTDKMMIDLMGYPRAVVIRRLDRTPLYLFKAVS